MLILLRRNETISPELMDKSATVLRALRSGERVAEDIVTPVEVLKATPPSDLKDHEQTIHTGEVYNLSLKFDDYTGEPPKINIAICGRDKEIDAVVVLTQEQAAALMVAYPVKVARELVMNFAEDEDNEMPSFLSVHECYQMLPVLYPNGYELVDEWMLVI